MINLTATGGPLPWAATAPPWIKFSPERNRVQHRDTDIHYGGHDADARTDHGQPHIQLHALVRMRADQPSSDCDRQFRSSLFHLTRTTQLPPEVRGFTLMVNGTGFVSGAVVSGAVRRSHRPP